MMGALGLVSVVLIRAQRGQFRDRCVVAACPCSEGHVAAISLSGECNCVSLRMLWVYIWQVPGR